MIGGNIIATVQIKRTATNEIGEQVETWVDAGKVLGFLDLSVGQNGVQDYSAKIQDSTHYFICDHFRWKLLQGVTSENSRMIFNGKVYNVLLIDNPMELNQHMEIYLKYIGGGL